MIKKIFKGITAFAIVAIVGSCAGNTITGIKNNPDEGFNILGSEDKGMDHFGKGNFMKVFIKDLNLTADQKAQFKAMKKEMKGNFSKHKEDRTAFINTIKTAFLSTSINKEDLKAKLAALKPQDDKKETLMAANIIKAYGILTPEQKTKIENKITEMETKFSNMEKNPMFNMFKAFKDKKIDWLTSDLNLNDNQKTEIKALFNEQSPDKLAMIENMKKVKNAVLAELKTGNASQDKMVEIIKQAKNNMESGMDAKLDKLIKVHANLNADQRGKLVIKVEDMMSKMKNEKGHHGW